MIRPPSLPHLPSPSVAAVTAKLDQLAQTLDAAKGADGAVDLKALRNDVAALGDPALKDTFESLLKGLDRRGPYVDLLRPEELRDVKSAIAIAKTRVGQFDENTDGVVQWDEGRKKGGPKGLSDNLAEAALQTLRADGEAPYKKWTDGVYIASHQAALENGARHMNSTYCDRAANHLGATPAAVNALTWDLRMQFVDGKLDPKLFADGEYGPLRSALKDRFESTGGLKRFLDDALWVNDAGSLSEDEVKKGLGTDDLEAFALQTQAALEAKVGMSFSDWVRGGDTADLEAFDEARRLQVKVGGWQSR